MDISQDGTEGRSTGDGHVFFDVKESQAYFQKTRDPDGRFIGEGQFSLLLNLIALQETVYIPLSLASSKKPTGFVYQIEGTSEGVISTTDISCRGDGVTQVTLGTLLYAKIPRGSTAHFRIMVEIKGGLGKVYKIVINRINYKLNPTDVRYKRFDVEIGTKTLKFR